MDFTLNFDDDLPLFSDSYDFSFDLEPKISKDIKYHLLSDTLESQKSSPFNPRKDLFITSADNRPISNFMDIFSTIEQPITFWKNELKESN